MKEKIKNIISTWWFWTVIFVIISGLIYAKENYGLKIYALNGQELGKYGREIKYEESGNYNKGYLHKIPAGKYIATTKDKYACFNIFDDGVLENDQSEYDNDYIPETHCLYSSLDDEIGDFIFEKSANIELGNNQSILVIGDYTVYFEKQ